MRLPLLALSLLAACAAPPLRSTFVLAQREELVLSNSPVMVERPAPVVRAGHLEVPYAVRVLNRGRAPVTLTAARAIGW